MLYNRVQLGGIVSELNHEEKTFNIEYVKCIFNNLEFNNGDLIFVVGTLKDGYVEVDKIIKGGD